MAVIARLVGLGLALSWAATAPAHAERFALDYRAEVIGGLDVGTARVDIDVTDDSYLARAAVESTGVARLFDQLSLQAVASGTLTDGRLGWLRYDLDHRYARERKRRVVILRRGADGAVAVDIRPGYRNLGDPAASDSQQRQAFDPVSALVAMAVHVRQTGGCNQSFPTFDGRYLYGLEVTAPRRLARYRAGAYSGPAIRCVLRYRPIAGYAADQRARNRIPAGEIWFATGIEAPFAPPVRISLPVPVGRAVITATRLQSAAVSVDLDQPILP